MGLLSYAEWKSDDWIRVLPIAALSAAVAVVVTQKLMQPKPWVNFQQQKGNPKVATSVDLEDIGDGKAYCRCWRSKQFPLCDGTHNEHNAKTGDNVGPLVVKKSKK